MLGVYHTKKQGPRGRRERTTRMRILLAEDEKSLARAIVAILKKNNYEADAVYDGEEALEPKNGNPYAALHTSKSLSEVDRLRLIIAKQEVEIARLKKGYWVEGVGANKEYVTGKGKTTKLSKK